MKLKFILFLALTSASITTAIASGGHSAGHDEKNESSAVGQPAAPSQATKTINVTTLDTMKFIFSSDTHLKDGEIVTFKVTNNGKTTHEFSIGDKAEQKSHRAMMRKMPNMTHQDGNAVSLKPGQTKELTWKFKKGEEVVFACNLPGHFEAGMFTIAQIEN